MSLEPQPGPALERWLANDFPKLSRAEQADWAAELVRVRKRLQWEVGETTILIQRVRRIIDDLRGETHPC